MAQPFYVNTLTDLSSSNNSLGDVVFVKDIERTSGNPFVWVGTSFTSNGGTLQPGSGGVWQMQFEGPVNVNWFGAVPNGLDVTTAFQAAVTYASSKGLPVYVPGSTAGYYRISQINLFDTSIVFGDYRNTVIVPIDSSVSILFNIEGTSFTSTKNFNNLHGIIFANIVNDEPVTSSCIAINIKYCDEFRMKELIVDGFDINLNIENTNNVFGNSLRLRGATRNNLRMKWLNTVEPPFVGTWIFMSQCEFNGGFLNNATIDEKFSVYIENYSSVTLNECMIVGNEGGGVKFVQTYTDPLEVRDMGYIVITSCDIDSNHAVGIRGEYARNCVIKGNWVSSGREDEVSGIDLAHCESCSITDNQCFYNGDSGIQIADSENITVSNNTCQNNGVGSAVQCCGIRNVNSQYNTFSANVCNTKQYGWTSGHQYNGIASDGSSDYNIFTSNILTPNTTALYVAGTNNVVSSNIV